MAGMEKSITDRPEVKDLADRLRGLKGAVIQLESNGFSVCLDGWYDQPEERDEAKEGDPDHWETIENNRENLELPEIKDAEMPHDLLAALAILAGIKVERC